ncbi:DUF4179 domain-containing protein [Paenibacillus sp. MMS20-IR301]|uniref:DUF4179 domain-containing protein n=1 Tax=Paenibacillus sp. MMS20-IR301 TaxID=2895946 RepID=UPI0028E1D4A8|nr:DUF4179 domain-containing protein [Paenibacillus sp. MMS20-IR301]WNS45793.1 DUF4179 domain-containing protein [Paenibacillus sp. MMS20-IR301]
MTTSEEALLKKYYHSLSAEAEEVAELKLNAAIRGGISRSRKYHLSPGKRYGLGIAAVLAMLLLFSLPWASEALKPGGKAQGSQAAAQNMDWIKPYSSIAGGDSTVTTAFEAGLIKQLSGATAEKDGYVLTVDGIAADRMGIILLYTLENKNEKALDYTFSVTDSKDAPLGLGQISGSSLNSKKTGIQRGYQIMQWNINYSKLPEQIRMKASVIAAEPAGEIEEGILQYENATEISVPVTLDLNSIAKSGETLAMNETVTVAGQDITIGDVYIAASGIYVETDYSAQNSMEIFSLDRPSILLGSGNDYTGLYSKSTRTVEGRQFLVFPGSDISSGSMKLKFDGIIGMEKSAQEFIVDTVKGQIIKGPDGRLRLASATEANRIVLDYYRVSNRSAADTVNVILDQTFKDGAGNLHDTAKRSFTVLPADPANANEKLPPYQYTYNLGTAKLQQPLTFKIISYPNQIKAKAELILRK